MEYVKQVLETALSFNLVVLVLMVIFLIAMAMGIFCQVSKCVGNIVENFGLMIFVLRTNQKERYRDYRHWCKTNPIRYGSRCRYLEQRNSMMKIAKLFYLPMEVVEGLSW